MKKKILLGLLIAAFLVGGAAMFYSRNTQKTKAKVYHVGILNALDYFSPVADGFKEKMTELGYVEGKNIFYDVQKAPSPVGNQAIIKKFVDDKVDLIFSFPTEASLEAKAGTEGTSIPVVAAAIGTEGSGLIESIQRPGGHLTGVRFPIAEVAARRIKIMHELAPNATRIMVPYLKDYPTVAQALAAIEPLAQALHITIIKAPFSTPDEVTAYLKAHEKDAGADVVLTIPEPISILPPFIGPILVFAEAHSMLVAGAEISDTDHGAAFSVIPSGFEMGQLAAPLADKIFNGIPAGSIPIATPESVFSINLKVLKRLGLTASEGLLSTADKIVH
jgi:putative tryptophan/tyrosine transport system substrate-binding protein